VLGRVLALAAALEGEQARGGDDAEERAGVGESLHRTVLLAFVA
jgi:hypothetical protein